MHPRYPSRRGFSGRQMVVGRRRQKRMRPACNRSPTRKHPSLEVMSTTSISTTPDYLDQLETEAIHIFREVAGQFERPALLFSGGKDSITLVHLTLKAFRPGRFPFPLVHIDTGHNFPEALAFRDTLAAGIGEKLIVRKVEETISRRQLTEPGGKFASRNALQTFTLLDTIEEFGFDACIGGARRDEEKARAKERIFSVRDEFGGWDPKRQRPELWNTYNG